MVRKFIQWVYYKYRNLKIEKLQITRDKIYKYFGVVIDYLINRDFVIDIPQYVNKYWTNWYMNFKQWYQYQ